jgi:hypothetical protein
MIYDLDLQIIPLLVHDLSGVDLRRVLRKVNWDRVHHCVPIRVVMERCENVDIAVCLSDDRRLDYRAYAICKTKFVTFTYWINADSPKLKAIMANDLRHKISCEHDHNVLLVAESAGTCYSAVYRRHQAETVERAAP